MSILSSIFGNYTDDLAKAAGKVAANNLDDAAKFSSRFWNATKSSINKGSTGSEIRNELKDRVLSALAEGNDNAAKNLVANMPVMARSSAYADDLSRGFGKYAQLTPSNRIASYGEGANSFTQLFDPQSAVKNNNDVFTKLISPSDTGFSPASSYNTLQDWSDMLKSEIGGIAESTEIDSRKKLQDYVYENLANNFSDSELPYIEAAVPTQSLSSVGRPISRTDIMKDYSVSEDLTNMNKHGDTIADMIVKKIKNSSDRSKAFDKMILGITPAIAGSGLLLNNLLNNKERSQNG